MERSRLFWAFTAAMALVIAASNYLVQHPFAYFGLGDILTWGAFSYPVAFLVTDLTNRHLGPHSARRVVVVGFALAVALSIVLATPRIAIASGTAFLVAQMLDVAIFDRLRGLRWWKAPLLSSLGGSVLDTVLFFSLAFAGTFSMLDRLTGYPDGSLAFPVSLAGFEIPLWVSLAIGDFAVKCLLGGLLLLPYGAALRFTGGLRPA